ncbi:hypothetical protein LDENG_00077990 [Lucifuga dentata]|nr:hypothetical protein LDENG_00077990 [Lucifuga dentata]
METQTRVLLQTLVLLSFFVHLSQSVCVDGAPETEAVLGEQMKLTCIFCMKREEVKATTHVNWYYVLAKDENGKTLDREHIFQYKDGHPEEVDGPWMGRLVWNGSQDLQDLSIRILNVTYNDSGTYECKVTRKFMFDYFTPSFSDMKAIELRVREKATKNQTALYSEIMMYVLLVFLTFWLLVEMVYCYRKISKSDEQAQDAATNYLAIPSEQKDNPTAPVTE